jgi:hypothetical protein
MQHYGAGRRRDVASTWKGGVKELVRVASAMQHYGAGQVGEMLHHRGRRRAKSECVLHQRCNTMELDVGEMLHQRGRAE